MFVFVVALLLCSSLLAYIILPRRAVCRFREMHDRIQLRNCARTAIGAHGSLIDWDAMRCARCGGFHPEHDDQCPAQTQGSLSR
jgi:hypothetical protein